MLLAFTKAVKGKNSRPHFSGPTKPGNGRRARRPMARAGLCASLAAQKIFPLAAHTSILRLITQRLYANQGGQWCNSVQLFLTQFKPDQMRFAGTSAGTFSSAVLPIWPRCDVRRYANSAPSKPTPQAKP